MQYTILVVSHALAAPARFEAGTREPTFQALCLPGRLLALGARGGVGRRASGCLAAELVAATGLRHLAEPPDRDQHKRGAPDAYCSFRTAGEAGAPRPAYREAAVVPVLKTFDQSGLRRCVLIGS